MKYVLFCLLFCFFSVNVKASNEEQFAQKVIELAKMYSNNPNFIKQKKVTLVPAYPNPKVECVFDMIKPGIVSALEKKGYKNIQITLPIEQIQAVQARFQKLIKLAYANVNIKFPPSTYMLWLEELSDSDRNYKLGVYMDKNYFSDGRFDQHMELTFRQTLIAQVCPDPEPVDIATSSDFKKNILQQNNKTYISVTNDGKKQQFPLTDFNIPLQASLDISTRSDGTQLSKDLPKVLIDGDRYYLYITVNKPAYVYIQGTAKIKDRQNNTAWATYLLEMPNYESNSPIRNTHIKNPLSTSVRDELANDSFVIYVPEGRHLLSNVGYEVYCNDVVPCGFESLKAVISETPITPPESHVIHGYNVIARSNNLQQTLIKTKGARIYRPRVQISGQRTSDQEVRARMRSIEDNVFLQTRAKTGYGL